MRFTLTYSGPVSSKSNATVKHGIRMKLHPQLKELWRTHPAIRERGSWVARSTAGDATEGQAALLKNIDGNDFSSLVHPYLRLHAELDILVLRPVSPGAVISHSGDIDNQLKTLFDALRRPTDSNEIPSAWSPAEDEKPVHCLLDDDKLVTRVGVETDRLLVSGADPKHVEVTIRATIKASVATWGNLGLVS